MLTGEEGFLFRPASPTRSFLWGPGLPITGFTCVCKILSWSDILRIALHHPRGRWLQEAGHSP